MTRVLLVTGSRSLAPRNMLGATVTEIERERIDAPKREAWARGDVDRAADALGWTAAAIETLLVDHPHWWPREELGPRG